MKIVIGWNLPVDIYAMHIFATWMDQELLTLEHNASHIVSGKAGAEIKPGQFLVYDSKTQTYWPT